MNLLYTDLLNSLTLDCLIFMVRYLSVSVLGTWSNKSQKTCRDKFCLSRGLQLSSCESDYVKLEMRVCSILCSWICFRLISYTLRVSRSQMPNWYLIHATALYQFFSGENLGSPRQTRNQPRGGDHGNCWHVGHMQFITERIRSIDLIMFLFRLQE